MTTRLPAVSFYDKGNVLEGSKICRILPADDSESAVKNRGLSTRPLFWASAICGFVAKNWGVLGGFRFFLALPKIKGGGSSLEQTNTQAPHNRLVPNVVKPLGPICDKENAGATSTK